MSTKSSIKFCDTKNLTFHLYECFVKGHQFSIKVGNMKESIVLDISKEESDQIVKELEEI